MRHWGYTTNLGQRNTNLTTEILVAFLSGSSFVAVINLIKWLIVRRDAKKEKKIPDVLGRIHEVYHVLNMLLRETGCVRALVLRAENGGDVPIVGKDLYSSVVYEVYDRAFVSMKDRWQRRPLDEAYIDLLLEVAKRGKASVVTNELTPCALKDLYVSIGIQGAVMIRLKAREGAFYYLSLNFDQPFDDEDPVLNESVAFAVSKIESLLD